MVGHVDTAACEHALTLTWDYYAFLQGTLVIKHEKVDIKRLVTDVVDLSLPLVSTQAAGT